MAMSVNFSNTVPDKKDENQETKILKELTENDKDTIYNLIFAEKPDNKKTDE